MTSSDDITPPSPEPLPADRKAVIRTQLLAAADHPPSAQHRWLLPGLAAAAVVAIVGAGAFVAGHDSEGSTGSPGSVPPAGQPRTAGSTTGQTTSAPGTARASHRTRPHPTTVPATRHVGRHGGGVIGRALTESSTCQEEIDALGRPDLDGATVTADRSYGDYTTSLYETKSAWVVCDDFAAADGGSPTLFALHDKAEGYRPDLGTLAVSDNVLFRGEVQFVAAGRDFDGVQAIRYVFPDGHTEEAVVGDNGLWSMTYLPVDGPLVDPDVNQTTLDPIEAVVDYTDGRQDSFTLGWGLDTCAQINHGC